MVINRRILYNQTKEAVMAAKSNCQGYNKPGQLLLGRVRLSCEPFLKPNLALTAEEKHELNLK
jgi:hypothetical protein